MLAKLSLMPFFWKESIRPQLACQHNFHAHVNTPVHLLFICLAGSYAFLLMFIHVIVPEGVHLPTIQFVSTLLVQV